MNNDLHQIQASILKELLFNNGSNFTSLNKLGLSNDHFTFHIKRLLAEGIIEKRSRLYFLTQKGKTFASKLDVDALVIEKQGGPSVTVTAKKMIKGKPHYLVQQRLKEPFFGNFGFINGKIRFGEYSKDTANRELLEEAGLTGTPKILTVRHRIGGSSKGDIKLDNFFFVYLVKNPKGELHDTKEGKNFWKTMDEIKQLPLFPKS
jgi:8-oxo-dGTP pyrophosphatase MutT (NUDIX family)